MVHATFDRDRVDVVVGGLELARAFTRVRWDHLLYTGSPAIGREIAQGRSRAARTGDARAGRQVPGDPDRGQRRRESIKQVLATKAIKNGQMCISVDYCLVPREQVEDFAVWRPITSASRCPAIALGQLHRDDLEPPPGADQGLLEEARARGATCARWNRLRSRSGRPPAADLARDRPARRPRPDAGGDLRPDPARSRPTTRSTRRSATSTRASGRWRCMCSPRTRPRRMRCCVARPPAVHA